ncbi:Metalloenzyme, LuxS/M16 peptidase-like protein [Radiomyces spectabilis]|uniref:Metalloenzyme, LuxS/M16 peptidase-like protein n=1 Tax=Radiomyces spectabilis TaxID=64574 RepID=UPI002220DDEB|nr:Metalloenzyme, LuxS/M16 peptidase-like protein [Radiomyces spectabilis]KAI8370689.1 Metalloenzyme, LuxS/M16 peptidase-like protein [Radiomyces spectabilis]
MVACSTTDWIPSADASHHVFSLPLEKPATDEREYRLLRLANQLEVLLISDPDTDRASAALDVHVGNLSDPDQLQGLAHFCEHLLFMGTKKYPKENDYYSYLSEHSGYANASTGTENTNYYFEVGHQWLEGALDRFAHFFIDPLFSDSCTERELRAVDSEHKKNLQSDCWRIAQVEKTLSNPNHPWRHFETGNLETLMENPKRLGVDIREELLKFHETYYSANIMKLCVLGQESLDQLTTWVVDKFSAVKNMNIPIPRFDGHPLTEKEVMSQIFVKSVKHNRTLDITFPFPDQSSYYESQPAHYISHLIGHEGPGSILSFLKKKGWATFLCSGTCWGAVGFDFFHVSADLTEDGLEHYEDVVVAIFQYIEMLKKCGVQKWIFDEVQSLAAIEFKFSEKYPPSQYTSMLTNQMQEGLPPQWTLSSPGLLRKYDPQLIHDHIALLRPDNFRLTLASQEFPNGIKCTQVERWYGTEYEVLPVSAHLKEVLGNLSANDAFKLPLTNEFIPTQLEVPRLSIQEKQRKPNLIQETPTLRLWHKQDDTFWMPKTNVWILFRNSLAYATPRNAVITTMFVNLLADSLTEYSYNAEVAGLSYYLCQDTNGVLLTIGGYSDKLAVLLEKVVQRMKELSIEPDRFDVVKDQTKRNYQNFFLEPPFQHVAYYLSYTIKEKMWKYDDLAAELEEITPNDVMTFASDILSHLHIEGLVHGTLTEEEATSMFRMVETILSPRPLMPSQFISHRSLVLPEGSSFVYQLAVQDPDDVNSAIEYYCQICDVTDIARRACLSLVAQIAQEPCFNQLRTREQLGYIVFSGIRRHTGTMGLRFIIQSEKDTVYLENRVEEFLDTLRDTIAKMSETDYKSQVNSLIDDKKEKFKNMGQEGAKYWSDIESGYYEFDDVEKDVAELTYIDKELLLAFYDDYIHPSSPKFRKLSIHMQSQKLPPATKPKFNVESLHTCMTSQGIHSKLSLEELKKAVDKDLYAGLPNDVILQKLLTDELKANEDDIEAVMKRMAVDAGLEKDKETELIQDAVSVKNGQADTEDAVVSTRDHSQLPSGNVIITDLIKFKHQMPLSAAAVSFFLFSRI